MNAGSGPGTALAWLGAVVATTAAWWALALWPVGPQAPDWVLRTRIACFDVRPDGLPGAGGWLLLIGQPLGMLGLLIALWRDELKTGVTRLLSRRDGQLLAGLAGLAVVVGGVGVAQRVGEAAGEPFAVRDAEPAAALTRVDEPAPALRLIDQAGAEVSLESLRGRTVVVTFAYAHCATVCPLVVSDVLMARRAVERDPPAVLIVTLDPWRDTPSRLPAIAGLWALNGEAQVLSGPPDAVERTLSGWRVPRARNVRTGDISHPSLVYVVDRRGRIAYVVNGGAEVVTAAVRAVS
jgi:protein SCO1/2